MRSKRGLLLIGGAVLVVILLVILLVSASSNPDSFPPYAAALAFSRAVGVGDNAAASAELSPAAVQWAGVNCPEGIAVCLGRLADPAWGDLISVVFRRAAPDGANAYDVELIATYEQGVGFSGICIYNRVEKQTDDTWKVAGWAGWIHCADPLSRDMERNPEAPNRVNLSGLADVPMPTATLVLTEAPPTETPIPTETPLPTSTPNPAALSSAVQFIEAVGREDNLAVQRLIHPMLREWVATNCPQGQIATCLNVLIPDEWGAFVSAIVSGTEDAFGGWNIDIIAQYEQGLGQVGMCVFVRMQPLEDRYLINGWAGWIPCTDERSQNLVGNPDAPNVAP